MTKGRPSVSLQLFTAVISYVALTVKLTMGLRASQQTDPMGNVTMTTAAAN